MKYFEVLEKRYQSPFTIQNGTGSLCSGRLIGHRVSALKSSPCA